MGVLLECNNITKKFGYFTALNQVNFTLETGRIIGLLGPNGSGKTTLMKLINGLLVPTSGSIRINGNEPGPASKLDVAYLPDASYLNNWMRAEQLIDYFAEFYSNFNKEKAYQMLSHLGIDPKTKLKTMSKGTKEKVQLILTMSREASLYCLDEPIGGVDPAARDYILSTILNNYNENGSVLISTHLISDVENVLDDAIIIQQGQIVLADSVDAIRDKYGLSVDAYFREVFKC